VCERVGDRGKSPRRAGSWAGAQTVVPKVVQAQAALAVAVPRGTHDTAAAALGRVSACVRVRKRGTEVRAHTHTYVYRLSLTHTHTLSHTHTLCLCLYLGLLARSQLKLHACAHVLPAHMYRRSLSLTHSLTLTHTHTHSLTHSLTHALSLSHTHSLSLYLGLLARSQLKLHACAHVLPALAAILQHPIHVIALQLVRQR
jgi:hypothetical protein